MAQVRIQWRRGYLGQVLRSQDVGDIVERKARRVLSAAEAGAPVDSGDYRASLTAVVGVQGGRVKARVLTTDPAGSIIEDRHGTLGNALGAARG